MSLISLILLALAMMVEISCAKTMLSVKEYKIIFKAYENGKILKIFSCIIFSAYITFLFGLTYGVISIIATLLFTLNKLLN